MLSSGPLADSESHDRSCGSGDGLGIEREDHYWWIHMRLESTKASRKPIKGVSITHKDQEINIISISSNHI